MRDERGRLVDIFVVSGAIEDNSGAYGGVKVRVTLLMRTGEEFRKLETYHTVQPTMDGVDCVAFKVSDPEGRNEKQFGDKWTLIHEAAARLAQKDATVGKLFVKEALSAYRAAEKLRPDQIADAMAGAFLVHRVEDL